MNYLIPLIVCLTGLNSFGQVHDNADEIAFKIEVTRVSDDSSFVLFKQFNHDTLILQEERIIIENQHCPILHGLSLQWYTDGKIKSKGYYFHGTKQGLWKYWDAEGTLTQDIDGYLQGEINIRGGGDFYYYIDGIKTTLRK